MIFGRRTVTMHGKLLEGGPSLLDGGVEDVKKKTEKKKRGGDQEVDRRK
jgi:hypothetical protein